MPSKRANIRRLPLADRLRYQTMLARFRLNQRGTSGGAYPPPAGGNTWRRLRRGIKSKAEVALANKRRRRVTKDIVQSGLGGMPSFSKFAATSRPSYRVKLMKKVGAPIIFTNNEAKQLIVQEGFQAVTQYGYQTLSDLNLFAAKLPFGGLPTFGQPPKNFVLENTFAEFLLTNSTLATVFIDIYDVARKRDKGSGTIGAYTQDPYLAWKGGLYSQGGAAVADPTETINNVPTSSKLFNDYFKVVKRTHIGLAQGACHRHHVSLRSNKLIDTELLNAQDGDMAGISMYTMIVVYGQPASAMGETGVDVTTAKAAIDIVVARRAKYTWLDNLQPQYYQVDGLKSLTGEQIVSAGSGQIATNAYV